MTELVDPQNIATLPGTSASTWFLGWAVADPNGQKPSGLTRTWLTQMCDSTLHLNNYEPVLDALANPRPEPRDADSRAPQVPTARGAQPITAEAAVQHLKQALPDPARRVELSDLVDQEIQRLAAHIADTTRHPLGGVPFEDQSRTYEEESATATRLLATGVFHGGETFMPLWLRSLRRLMTARRPFNDGSYNTRTEAMRHYPALMCLWAMGLSAILTDRENLLARFLLEPTWTPIFGEPNPEPAVHCLNPNRIVAAAGTAPNGAPWLYPQSHHMRAAGRSILSQIEPDDNTYQEPCDRLEYLASLIAMDTDAPNGPPWAGEFLTRDRYHSQDPKLENLLEGGAFNGDPERAQTARKALTAWITQHPKF